MFWLRFFRDTFDHYKTTNAHNQQLAVINGSYNASNTSLSNILINGNAQVGKNNQTTICSQICVVNGNLHARHASFETLEVNGNAELNYCHVTNNGEFFGYAQFINCNLRNLNLRGKSFMIKNSIVTGNIIFNTVAGKGKLVLDNTIVEGSITFTQGTGEIVLYNGACIKK